jgi:hypothetical protein
MAPGSDVQDGSSRCATHHERDGPMAGIASVNRSYRSVLPDEEVRLGRNDTRERAKPGR